LIANFATVPQKVSKGLTVGSVITGSTFLHGPPVLALGFTKLFKKSKKVDETNIQLANSWIGVNNHLIEKVLPNLKWDMGIGSSTALFGVSLDIENYCTLRLFFDLSTLAGLNRRNLPEAGILLLFQI
ncbi:hypothetical protein, partial [Enterobacter hormaechei]